MARLNSPGFIAGPAGKLQLLVDSPEEDARAVAVICHPHTQHGGTLANKVVHQVARTFTGQGAVSVRFNFRGAGDSEGEYDAGVGEVDDLTQVVNWVRGQCPGLPLWLAGFSFGAYVALLAAKKLAPDWLVTIAPPVNLYDVHSIQVTSPHWLVIQGSEDEIVPADAVLAWTAGLQQPPQLAEIAGAGHFFHGQLNVLKDQLTENMPHG